MSGNKICNTVSEESFLNCVLKYYQKDVLRKNLIPTSYIYLNINDLISETQCFCSLTIFDIDFCECKKNIKEQKLESKINHLKQTLKGTDHFLEICHLGSYITSISNSEEFIEILEFLKFLINNPDFLKWLNLIKISWCS